MEKSATLRQQLEAFSNGQIMDVYGQTDTGCYNFYDWFCNESALENKARRLFGNVKTFVKRNPQIDLDNHYVFFKNNSLINGHRYDDFRICDRYSNDVVWTVIPKSSHSGMAEVWGSANDFREPINEAETFRGLFKA